MKIVLFGGTFDPVHAEHVKLARGAIKELSPDKLIVLPSYVPPHKAGASASAEHRLKMAQIAFSFDPRIEVSDYEISKGGSSYSYITVEHFRSLYPDVTLGDVPDAVWEDVRAGGALEAAYALWERKEAIRCAAAQEANRKNATGAWGRADTAGEDFLSPDEVRSMTQDEVRRHYARIVESMKHWN